MVAPLFGPGQALEQDVGSALGLGQQRVVAVHGRQALADASGKPLDLLTQGVGPLVGDQATVTGQLTLGGEQPRIGPQLAHGARRQDHGEGQSHDHREEPVRRLDAPPEGGRQ